MLKQILLKGGTIVTPQKTFIGDILIEGPMILKVGKSLKLTSKGDEINVEGKIIFPGLIDTQVHFRQPGLTDKGTIATESRAAVAGGTTSYMEMPNTIPNALTQELLEDKYDIAAQSSYANYSFYMGTSNDNFDEIMKTDLSRVCGLKIFMGSSTGNMLVDNAEVLRRIFKHFPGLIATHCEDEATIKQNTAVAVAKYNGLENIPIWEHPNIRSAEACYLSSSFAVKLAKQYGTRLHVLHISTAKELELFRNDIPLKEKRITAEACMHHLWFTDADYEKLGTRIKWNPAIKTAADRDALRNALLTGHIDVIATDHAPHATEEKANGYGSPSGAPLVQHELVMLYKMYLQGLITLPQIAKLAAYNPAVLFKIKNRGLIAEGYYADLAIFDPQIDWRVRENNIFYKCGWSPLEGEKFSGMNCITFVNGELTYRYDGQDYWWIEKLAGMRLEFDRK